MQTSSFLSIIRSLYDFCFHSSDKYSLLYVLYQTFPLKEQLQKQYLEKAHPEPYACLLKSTAVKNVLADPDVPPGCDANSAECVSQDDYCFFVFKFLFLYLNFHLIIFFMHCFFLIRFDLEPGAKSKLGSGDRDEALSGLIANLSLEGLIPHWIRPLPPRFPVDEEVKHFSGLLFNRLVEFTCFTCQEFFS